MQVNAIRATRIKMSKRKKTLANAVGLTLKRLTAIENGVSASSEEYAKIAIELDTPTDELYSEYPDAWADIEKKRQFIEIQKQIDLNELQRQADEQEVVEKELRKKRAEKEKVNNRLRKLNKDHEARLREHEELTDRATKNRILRELDFPPEYQQAGITILQGFVKLINRKYKDENVSVTIKQSGMKVVLIIKTPDGKTEEVEEYLDNFSLVVTGKEDVETLTNDPIAIVELKGQLQIAKMQVEQQRDISLILKNTHEERITSLEEDNQWFKEQLALSFESSKSIAADVLQHLQAHDDQIAVLAMKLIEIVELDRDKSTQKKLPSPDSTKNAKKVIDDLNSQVLKDGVGKGLSNAVQKLISWATLKISGL